MHRTSTRASALRRFRLLGPLVTALLAAGSLADAATAATSDGWAAVLPVGHAVERVGVPVTDQNVERQVDVHLWYPADRRDVSARPKTIYTSALHGRELKTDQWTIPEQWDPLSWSVEAEIAREGAAVDPHGQPFPVIVFSHGSVNDPINYAHMLELIASGGFVVAAPSHVTDTQEDVRIDFINDQARRLVPPQPRLFACNDGLPSPCSRPNNTVPRRMADRAGDISKVLDELAGWFGARVDLSRVGVLGHSRGTLSGLAAAAGSTAWGVRPERRVKAVMGMASGGTLPVTLQPNLAEVRVPTLLVAGKRDTNSALSINEALFNQIGCPVEDPLRPVGCADPRAEKAFVLISDAHHRSFISTFCDQTQATGAIAQANPRAIFETNAVTGLLTNLVSGKAMDYCSYATFTSPTDIRLLVASLTGFTVTADNVPTTGLDTEEVKHGIKELAVAFFGTVLKRVGNDGPHFTRYLAPKWLEKHDPMVGRAEAFASADAICPPGQCED